MTEPRNFLGITGADGSPTQWISYSPLRNSRLWREPECHNARVARQRQQREAEEKCRQAAAAALATADQEWGQVHLAACCDHSDSGISMAVLAIHKPVPDGHRVVCAECEEFDGYESGGSVDWPCRTFTAMREAV